MITRLKVWARNCSIRTAVDISKRVSEDSFLPTMKVAIGGLLFNQLGILYLPFKDKDGSVRALLDGERLILDLPVADIDKQTGWILGYTRQTGMEEIQIAGKICAGYLDRCANIKTLNFLGREIPRSNQLTYDALAELCQQSLATFDKFNRGEVEFV